MSNALNSIEIGIQDALQIVNSQLPLIKAFIPAVAAAGGPVGLGIAAATALIPLIEQLPIGDQTLSVADQQALMDEVNGIVSGAAFNTEAWHPTYFPTGGTQVTADQLADAGTTASVPAPEAAQSESSDSNAT